VKVIWAHVQEKSSPLRLLVTAFVQATVIAMVPQAGCAAAFRGLPPIGDIRALLGLGSPLLSLAVGYAVTWKEWRKYPLVFTLLSWGVMWSALVAESFEILLIGSHGSL